MYKINTKVYEELLFFDASSNDMDVFVRTYANVLVHLLVRYRSGTVQ